MRRAAALQAHPLTLGARIVLHPRMRKRRRRSWRVAKVDNGVGTATLPVAISDASRAAAPGSNPATARPRRWLPARVEVARMTADADVVDPFRDWLLSFGVIGLLVWIVLKILLIAVPVIISVAFYVVWERKVIGWMQVRHGPNRRRPHGHPPGRSPTCSSC